jgi:hypothetical protein
MPTRRFERITLAQLLLSGCAVVFGACVLIEQARAQYVPPPTPLPPPVFNPSSPYTVPQPSYRPIAPATPSASPGYVVTSPPVSGRPPRTAARSQRRTSVAKTRSGPLRDRSPWAGILFLLLLAFRIWLWLRVVAGMGRILVPDVALFVTEKRS